MNQDVRALFHELVDLSPGEREGILADRQIGPEVRAEIDSLLSFDSTNIPGIADCVADAAQHVLNSANGQQPGSCGPYRLVRLLGSGGMGAVYLAERSDGEIQQRVAVKLLRADAHHPAWRDRFLRERQLLASLNHPSIVRVIDAGHTADGRPYLVMEYVDGIPIDVYAAGIEVRERLALFLRVCAAVSHAHRHLIIHRDLKPSNILVDASGQPKVLDFGIGKLLDETGDATQTIERLLTPNYASPEQLRGTAQTTATDVYSLGAVLYKLLTGRSPHQPEPGTTQAIGALTGAREITAPSRLNPSLPTDLDYVLRKALRQEPDERYASVEALAGDIRAFLESRPVQARSGNAGYRARKFLRRYRVPVAAAILVIASLSTGLYIANRERAIAQRRFLDVRELAAKLFDIDVQVRALPGSTKTRQLIVNTSLEYLQRLVEDARKDPELALEVGNAYMRVARVQGVPISPTLGQADLAEQNLRIADRLMQSVLQAQPMNRTAMLRSAQIAHDLMILARFKDQRAEPLALARTSAQWLERFNPGKADESEGPNILITYYNVADQFILEQQFEEALRLSARGNELARILNRAPYRGMFLKISAQAFARRGELEQALDAIRESVRLLDPGPSWRNLGGQSANFTLALSNEGKILGEGDSVSLARPVEALACFERAFSIADDFVHRDPNDHNFRGHLAVAAIPMAGILRDSNPSRALDIYDHTLRHIGEAGADAHLQHFEVQLLVGSSYALQRLGRAGEARRRLDTALDRLRQLKLYPAEKIYSNSESLEVLEALGDYEANAGNVPRAIEVYEELLGRFQPAQPNSQPELLDAVRVSTIYRSAAALYRRAGNAAKTSALERRRLELWQDWDSKLPNNAFVHRQLEAAHLP